jgi:thiol-disulfide isomerase/thioredoxin
MKSSRGCAVRRPNWKNNLLLIGLLWLAAPLSVAEDVPELSYTMTRIEPPVAAGDFTLTDMDGAQHRLSDYRGKVVLVNFWATWCPPCRKEMPSLERLYQHFKGRSFMVLAINQWETVDHVFSYMGDLNVFPEFPILFDRESKVSEDFGVRGLPTSFIVDTEGRIIYKAVGGREFDHPGIMKLIEELLPQAHLQAHRRS